MQNATITFPYSRVRRFVYENNGQRWGQQFYEFMGLDKVTNINDKMYCDKIYNEPKDIALILVENKIDYLN